MGYVYLVTNVLTGKQYVGQTQRLDINKRWNQHKKGKYGLGRYIRAAYCKYGIENFQFMIICVCFDDDCDRYEDEYINKYKTLAPNGYNLRAGGGNSGKHHPDTIKLMSERQKGRKGTPHSPETIKKLREAQKGSKNPNFGKKLSEEQKQKMSATRKERIKNGQITYHFMSEASLLNLKKARYRFRRKITQCNASGECIATYESVTEAAIQTGTPACCIRNVLNPKRPSKTAGGYIWKVYTD